MKKNIFIVILLFQLSNNAFSRAEGSVGGGRSGGGGSYGGYSGYSHGWYGRRGTVEGGPEQALLMLTAVLTSGALIGYVFYARIERKKIKTRIKQSKKFDSIWNHNKLKSHAESIFTKVQHAWMDRDLAEIDHLLSKSFIKQHTPLLQKYTKQQIKNVVAAVSLTDVRILEVHDDADDTKDAYAVHFQGWMKDFLAHENSNISELVENAELVFFKDLYIFRRNGSRWILDEIINDAEAIPGYL
ncbi:MAG TPA: TIM44-like domain-containing protein [Flavobacteriales bacterium]|nr:TIM44-like domain-containing protein [Flavobacteriales bacterium]